MNKQLIIGLALLLLGGAPALAQRSKVPASVTPTRLPGEEKLSGQERAERDFLMPVRRKQAEVLKALESADVPVPPAAIELTARSPEAEEEVKAPEAIAPQATPTARRTSSRSSSPRTSASRRKVGRFYKKKSSSKRKHAARRPGFRRR